MTKKVQVLVCALLAVVTIFFAVKTITMFGDRDHRGATEHTITVSGTGEVFAVPDVARMQFSVSKTEKDMATAQNSVSEITNAVLAKIRVAGILDKDVKTISYNANPAYDYGICSQNGCPKPKLTGYTISTTIEITIRDTTKTGSIATLLGTLGVENISGPNFGVDDEDTVKSSARAKAIIDARAKATLLASQLGVRLGDIVSFSEDAQNYPMPMYARAGMAVSATDAKVVTPELPQGENKVTSSVSVTYKIR